MLRTRTRKVALSLRIFVFLSVTLTYVLIASASSKSSSTDDVTSNQSLERNSSVGRHLLSLIDGVNCTPPAINEFPSDGLTREQRQHGWIVIHVILACYLFILLAIVCDDFFVPAIKKFCDRLHMSEDVAGATFMAVASSSSELFVNSVGTFVTQGDIGVGTILGSAVFNILAVPACCGLVSNMVVDLEWWPLTRDSLMYGSSVVMLIMILQDGKVELYEACILVGAYAIYIAVICFTKQISNCLNRLIRKCKKKKKYTEILQETHPLLGHSEKNVLSHGDHKALIDSELTLQDCEDLEESTNIWEWPKDQSSPGKAWWVLTWPISFLLFLTIPDCRKHPRLYVCTFLMCIMWIGSTSYTVAWLITVIGDTVNIPDSVMGLTFLAAGTSVPEAVSSVIVTNQGHGAMGLSSSIGSNTFDILLCLGLPWTIKSWLYPKVPGEHSIIINSSGITYSAFCLLSTLFLLYFSVSLNRFKLDWKIGLSCLLMYICFLTFASLVELNVFFPVNLPTCDR